MKSTKTQLAVCGSLLLAVGLVFGQTVRYEFINYDDHSYVFENSHVRSGITLSGLWWALTDGPLREWCPATVVSHMLDCQLYGLNPAGHHLTNVLLHGASSVLLFLVLLRMTGALWPSAWVAAIFAIHPLHVESVAWVAERRDVLSGLFFMLTLLAYAWYAEQPSIARYLAVAGFFALGLAAKPMLVTLPCVLLLLDYWPLGRFRGTADADLPAASRARFDRLPAAWRLVVEKIPLMVLAAATAKIAMSFHSPGASASFVTQLSPSARLSNALVSYAAYLGQSFYPVDMALFYPLRADPPAAWAAESFALLLTITVAVALFWRRRPYLVVGWLWFLGMLVPATGLVQFGAHARADRYTYLSQIGLSIALAWGVWSVYQSRQFLHATRWRPSMLSTASGAAVLLLAVVAWRQTTYWHDSDSIWTHTLACTEENWMAHYNIAAVRDLQRNTEAAMMHLRQTLQSSSISPYYTAETHDRLAILLTEQGKTGEALEHHEEAVRICPTDAALHARLAVALAAADRHDEAIAQWRETVRLEPDDLGGHIGLADTLRAHGDLADAEAECRAALKLNPASAVALGALGAALAAQGKTEEAVSCLEQSVQLESQSARIQFDLGLALASLGRSESAAVHLDEALRLQPENIFMLWQTAWILATSPDPSIRDGGRAIKLARTAIQLSGGQEAHAFDALAAALAEIEKFSAAADAADKASAMALARNDHALAEAIQQRARLYRQGLPYRKTTASVPAGRAPAHAPE